MKLTKAERCQNLRYRKPALASMGYSDIIAGLEEIEETCADIHWWIDGEQDFLIDALGGEEEAFNFRFAFSDLETDAERLSDALREYGWHIDRDDDEEDDEYTAVERAFDDMTVALVGNRFRLVGFDDYEMDYFSLAGYESSLAETEAGKRVMRMTKKEMLSSIGECMGILLAYMDLQYKFDRLKATMDILEDKNSAMLDTIKDIEKAYDDWAKNTEYYHGMEISYNKETEERFNKLLETLPPEIWCN